MIDQIAIFAAQYLFLAVFAFAALYILLYYRDRIPTLVVAGVAIGGVAYLLSKIATRMILSPRPFVESGQPPLIPSATDNGFPSDHILLLAAVAATVTLVNRKVGALLWVLALLVGLARVYVGVHHPIDVIGSFVLVALASAGYLLGRKLWHSRQM